jgi:hypothetical protein
MANAEKHRAIKHVCLELSELKKLGVSMPVDPENLTAKQEEMIVESYENGGMKISEITDMIIALASLQ